MVCNHGQSELLMNFVCSTRARGISTKNILIFATDEETKAIAENMGLTAFYDEQVWEPNGALPLLGKHDIPRRPPHLPSTIAPPQNFGSMPKQAAEEYGDVTFMKMMMAKVGWNDGFILRV
jgi:hypothetical protein